jgi:hypothetical protein
MRLRPRMSIDRHRGSRSFGRSATAQAMQTIRICKRLNGSIWGLDAVHLIGMLTGRGQRGIGKLTNRGKTYGGTYQSSRPSTEPILEPARREGQTRHSIPPAVRKSRRDLSQHFPS